MKALWRYLEFLLIVKAKKQIVYFMRIQIAYGKLSRYLSLLRMSWNNKNDWICIDLYIFLTIL